MTAPTKQAIIDTLTRNIEEARKVAAETTRGWVVADEKDYLPIRKGPNGELRFFGGPVWVTLADHTANGAASKLNARAAEVRSSAHLVSMPDRVWAERRIAVLEELLAELKD